MTSRPALVALTASLLLASACTDARERTPGSRAELPRRVAPTRPPTASGTDPGRIEVPAPILRVGIRVAESFPPQYFADITSALPSGCARFARTAVRREGEVVFVDVFNSEPAGDGIACSMIYGEQQTAVALGSDFEPGRTYTLDVNGTRERFTAQK